MPALLALLVNMLRMMLLAKAGLFILKILGFFGLQFVTYRYAVEPMLNQLQQYVANIGSGSLGASAVQWAGVLRLDVAVTMVVSAYMTALTIKQAKVALGVNSAN